MKILYAAGNSLGSYYQLQRYLPLFQRKTQHQFKIAAFKKSLGNFNCDFCLDCLLNFRKPAAGISFNGNYVYYAREVLKFAPDLIISDFEIFTSLIGIENKIPVWQVSPILLYYGSSKKIKNQVNIHKHYSHFISGERGKHQYIQNILNNSEKKLVLSCLGDIQNSPELLDGFEWCRPEFKLSSSTNTFTTPLKTLGYGTFLTDAFYNQQYSLIELDVNDLESIISSYFHSYFQLGELNQNSEPKIKDISIELNNDAKFLMELL